MKTCPKKRRSSRPKSPATGTKILIIDSDLVLVKLLRSYLEGKKGITVLTSETGAGGIKTAVKHTPDLILLDFRLADMSGLDVHEELRQHPATEEIPVIYVSSFLTLRTIEQATVKGARGFISKPFSLSEMYTKVATVLSST